METLTKSVIVTRYNEHIDWIEHIINHVDTIYIYNKGTNENFFKYAVFSEEKLKKIKIQSLPNIGRIDHTLVYHILEHWDNLPNILINLPGSVMMCKKKGFYLSGIVKRINYVKSKYNGFYAPRFKKCHPEFNYTIDNYRAEGFCNRNDNPFVKSEYSDFQVWKKAIVDDRPIRYIAMRGMFIVCKENILHIKKEIYTNLLTSLSVGDNIENGHFAERIWAHLFRQYSFDIIKPDGYEEELSAIRNPN